MPATFQLVINAIDPDAMCRFWTQALGYVVEPPPAGFETWNEYWHDVGVPEDEDQDSDDRIVDPEGAGPRIWFQLTEDVKTVPNRIHLDISVGGGRNAPMADRRARVDAKVAELAALGAMPILKHGDEGLDHYAVTLQDPEGNEFCVN